MLTIRTATEADLTKIVGIYNASIPGRTATADLEPVTVESRIDWFNEHESTSRPLWVAELDGRVTAWLSFQSFYGRPAYARTAEVSVYVSPEHFRKGIGAKLLCRAIEHAPRFELSTLLGFIFEHNTPSLRLFSKCGFEQWGRLPGVAVLDQFERNLVILGKRIC